MRDSPTPRRIRAFVWAATMVFMGAVVLVSVALVMNARRVALDDYEAQASRFVAGAESALNRSLLAVDVLLASMDELLGLSVAVNDWVDAAPASERLRSSARQNLMVRYVALLNAQGQTLRRRLVLTAVPPASSPGARRTGPAGAGIGSVP